MSVSKNRRSFLKATAAAAATARFPILGANNRIRTAVIGLGGRGRDHVQFLSELPGETRITAICDVNQEARERAVAQVEKLTGAKPKEYSDLRAVYDDREVDAVTVATPNHWHALATIWACQAGKDVYVEKPACHNVLEGEQMVVAARKHGRMVQVGSQSRSMEHRRKVIELLRQGVIGQLYMARGLCFRRRKSIGHTPDEPVPPGINWDLFLGPAQMKPFSRNKYAYNWHWFWDTGNGDIGNQGVHEMDLCLWALGRTGWPRTVVSSGGKFAWHDDQETPNAQQAAFDFGDAQLTFEVRNLPSPSEGGAPTTGSNYVGNIFFGTEGYLVTEWQGFRLYKGDERALVMDEKAPPGEYSATPHLKNFFDAVRSRDAGKLNADVEVGVAAANYCHLANIAYRVGRTLRMAQSTGRFAGDEEANAMLTRNYRHPYVVPAAL